VRWARVHLLGRKNNAFRSRGEKYESSVGASCGSEEEGPAASAGQKGGGADFALRKREGGAAGTEEVWGVCLRAPSPS